jgi:hypothetical protein
MPASVRAAVVLMLTAAGIQLVMVLVFILTDREHRVREEFLKDHADLQPHVARTYADVVSFTSLTFGALVLSFSVVVAILVARGVQWARIVAWVLAGLTISGLPLTLVTDHSADGRSAASVEGVLSLATAYLLIVGGRGGFFHPQPHLPAGLRYQP